MAKLRKLPFYAISAVSGQGVDALKYAIAAEVKRAREAERESATQEATTTF
jgi:GTP-binding protein